MWNFGIKLYAYYKDYTNLSKEDFKTVLSGGCIILKGFMWRN